MGDLGTLFAPDSVAVVGASEQDGSVGSAITTNLLDGYEGEIQAVNPNAESVYGLECADSLEDVGQVDVAVVVVPASIAVDVVETAGDLGIRNVVVITAGFGESGSEGANREQALIQAAEEYDINLVGPNSLGILSTGVGMNATFAPTDASPGSISFMSQSGAFITAVLDWASDRTIGFRDVVSLGNKAALNERDFVEHWGTDPDTEVILGYLEDVVDGQAFMDTAREVAQDTPIVVVKSGRTEAGATAAASHTGAMAGSDEAYAAGLEQAGVLRVHSVEELFDAAAMLSGQPLPNGDSIAVVTNAGGPGVMTTDAVGDSRLEMASFGDQTRDALEDALPGGAAIHNPVDVIGDASSERFGDAIDSVMADGNVDLVLVLACPTATLSFEELARTITECQERHELPVATSLMGGTSTRAAEASLSEEGIPTYFDPARAVRGLETLSTYRDIREREHRKPTTFDVDRERAREILGRAAERGTNRLGVEAMELLDAYGIPTPQGAIVEDAATAQEVAADIDGDVVMKIVSPDILHKSDIGGVEVGVAQADVADTYEDLISRARSYQPDASIIGVQVQETLDLDAGVETIVGMTRDPQFGPLVLFGLGGIFVEVLEDTTSRVAPVSEATAREMVTDIDSSPLLYGARGRDPVDVDGLVDLIQRLSQLVTDFPAITELDINPALASPDGATAVDLRLTLDQEKL